jgi:hypothetical protein
VIVRLSLAEMEMETRMKVNLEKGGLVTSKGIITFDIMHPEQNA